MIIGLTLVLLAVLVLPFIIKQVEHNLEAFLLLMGICATCISGAWFTGGHFNWALLVKACRSPLMITAAVFTAGLLFKLGQQQLRQLISRVLERIPLKVFLFALIVVLGLASSVITAIVASLVLVEVINVLQLERRQEAELCIIACFSIGLGAVLTPLGEPLATIAISKMGQDFWYLMRLLGVYVIPGIVALGGLAAFYVRPQEGETLSGAGKAETFRGVLVRTLKVYLFVMALELLGRGFQPVVDLFLLGLPGDLLYWLNMISAVLDNATLTAAEISIKMSQSQVRDILLGLLISGGMLIPGNIPNIISAGKLKISSREWARLGVPLGLAIMVIYFAVINL
jgi:predicted cation transporter